MLRRLLSSLLAASLVAGEAIAQPGVTVATGTAPAAVKTTSGQARDTIPVTPVGRDSATGVYCVLGSSATCGLPAADPNNAPFLGERPLTVGVTDSVGPGRAVKANCTNTGAVSVTYSDGSTGLWMVQATGTSIFAAEIVQINSSGTTATCTYGNMK